MKFLFLLSIVSVLEPGIAMAADWQCGSVSKDEHGNYFLNLDSELGKIYAEPYLLAPLNEPTDDFLHATKSNRLCVKGRRVGTQPASFLIYDSKEMN